MPWPSASVLASILLIGSLHAAQCAGSYHITSLRSTSPAFPYSASQRSSITFTVHDPNPATKATTACTASWHRVFGGNPPPSWINPPTNFTFCARNEQHHNTYLPDERVQKFIGTKGPSETPESVPEFQFRVGDGGWDEVPGFENASSFGLTIAHSYQDPKAGNWRKTFARFAVNESYLDCWIDSLQSKICELKEGLLLQVPVYAMV